MLRLSRRLVLQWRLLRGEINRKVTDDVFQELWGFRSLLTTLSNFPAFTILQLDNKYTEPDLQDLHKQTFKCWTSCCTPASRCTCFTYTTIQHWFRPLDATYFLPILNKGILKIRRRIIKIRNGKKSTGVKTCDISEEKVTARGGHCLRGHRVFRDNGNKPNRSYRLCIVLSFIVIGRKNHVRDKHSMNF